MARNEEKAQSMLNRWMAYKRDLVKGESGKKVVTKGKRPPLASNVTDVQECESWRMQIMRDIGRKVMEIQNGKFFAFSFE